MTACAAARRDVRGVDVDSPAPPPSAGPDEETVRIARKDFRTPPQRRSLAPAAAGPARAARWSAVVAAAVWVVFFSSYVTADDVDVTGTTTLGDGRSSAPPTSRPAPRWPGSTSTAIQARVEAIAAVRKAEVSRSWPHAMHIEVTERTPSP